MFVGVQIGLPSIIKSNTLKHTINKSCRHAGPTASLASARTKGKTSIHSIYKISPLVFPQPVATPFRFVIKSFSKFVRNGQFAAICEIIGPISLGQC